MKPTTPRGVRLRWCGRPWSGRPLVLAQRRFPLLLRLLPGLDHLLHSRAGYAELLGKDDLAGSVVDHPLKDAAAQLDDVVLQRGDGGLRGAQGGELGERVGKLE